MKQNIWEDQTNNLRNMTQIICEITNKNNGKYQIKYLRNIKKNGKYQKKKMGNIKQKISEI